MERILIIRIFFLNAFPKSIILIPRINLLKSSFTIKSINFHIEKRNGHGFFIAATSVKNMTERKAKCYEYPFPRRARCEPFVRYERVVYARRVRQRDELFPSSL